MPNNSENSEYQVFYSRGTESLLESEIEYYDLRIKGKIPGGYSLSATAEEILPFLTHTRFATRIGKLLFFTKIRNPEDLYKKAFQFPWEKVFPTPFSFQIDSRTRDVLNHSQYALYKLKDAIFDRARDRDLPIPVVSQYEPSFTLLLRAYEDNAFVLESLSTNSLTKRGYRFMPGAAPLRENLAQTMLAIADFQENDVVYDPFCGSGTIVLESVVLIATKGEIHRTSLSNSKSFLREYPNFQFSALKSRPPSKHFFGSDLEPPTIEIAQKNESASGFQGWVEWFVKDATSATPPSEKPGHIITNPPFGERLGNKEELRAMMERFGKQLKNHFSGWDLTIVTGDSSLLGPLDLKTELSHPVKIGDFSGKINHYKIKQWN